MKHRDNRREVFCSRTQKSQRQGYAHRVDGRFKFGPHAIPATCPKHMASVL